MSLSIEVSKINKVVELIKKFIVASFALSLMGCGFVYPSHRAFVGEIEANHPWIIFDPTREQGMVSLRGDKSNSDIVYLIPVWNFADSVKINLRTKKIAPYRFAFEKWEDISKSTLKFEDGFLNDIHGGSLWTEFRGEKQEIIVDHLYGDPLPIRPGKRKSTRRTGYYYILEKADNLVVERLRVKIENSELSWGGLGSVFTSPDGKWLIFRLQNSPSRIIVFNREEKGMSPFPVDRKYSTIEVFNL